MHKLRLAAATAIICLSALIVPGAASARTITLGSELVAEFNNTQTFAGSSHITVANAELTGPINPASAPVDGMIVRWRLAPQTPPLPNEYQLMILHPEGNGTYRATATSDPEVASTTVTEVFPTTLPIKAGDLIGLDIKSTEPEPKIHVAPLPGATQFCWVPFLGLGSPGAPTDPAPDVEFPFNADLAPVPGITRVVPDSGPVAGGTAVTIVGRDFTGVSGVSFGPVPASSFVVDSEGEITAVAPPSADAGPVDITMSNAFGTSSDVPQDRFTYLAPPVVAPTGTSPTSSPAASPAGSPLAPTPPGRTCKVPRLNGKTLPASRRILSRSRCRLGAIRGQRRAGKEVTRQSPRPGVTRPAGWAVNVTIR
jgi:hypothetical protein